MSALMVDTRDAVSMNTYYAVPDVIAKTIFPDRYF